MKTKTEVALVLLISPHIDNGSFENLKLIKFCLLFISFV